MIRDDVSSTGGARIGWVNASWPFARLSAQQNQLVLNASLIGKYSFTPEQVVAIEKYAPRALLGWGPSLGCGLRIHHNIPTYPQKIVFWCFGSPQSLIGKIEETGFVAKASPDSVPADRGIPVRWQALVGIVLLWNGLFLLDMHFTRQPGVFSLAATLLLFIGSLAIWRLSFLRHIIMKPGRSCEEIKAVLYLLALVSGLLSIWLVFSLLAGWP